MGNGLGWSKPYNMRKLYVDESALTKPTQHLTLHRLPLEMDCTPCYQFLIEHYKSRAFENVDTAQESLNAGYQNGHYGQHVFAIELRERVELR